MKRPPRFGIVARAVRRPQPARRGCHARWLPLSLQWRRRIPKRSRRPGTHTLPSSVWAPLFHLHFDRSSHWLHTSTRAATIFSLAGTHAMRTRELRTLRTPPLPHPIAAPIRLHTCAPTTIRLRVGGRQTIRIGNAARHSITPTNARLRAPDQLVLKRIGRGTRRIAAYAPQGDRRGLTVVLPEVRQMHRPVTLEWRDVPRATGPVAPTPHPGPEHVGEQPRAPIRGVAPGRLEQPGVSGDVPALASASMVAQAARSAVSDPAITDRIADEVIRRMERRSRIERERRGL